MLTETQAQAKSGREQESLKDLFMEQLDVDAEIAAILVREGFASLEEVAYVPAYEMLEIQEFDEEIVEELRNRARDALLTRAIAAEERMGDAEPAEDLLHLEGMDEELAYLLAGKGITTQEALAELAVDDLTELVGLDEARAARLIMAARAPWFSQGQQG